MCLQRPLYKTEALNTPLYISNTHKGAFLPILGINGLNQQNKVTINRSGLVSTYHDKYQQIMASPKRSWQVPTDHG